MNINIKSISDQHKLELPLITFLRCEVNLDWHGEKMMTNLIFFSRFVAKSSHTDFCVCKTGLSIFTLSILSENKKLKETHSIWQHGKNERIMSRQYCENSHFSLSSLWWRKMQVLSFPTKRESEKIMWWQNMVTRRFWWWSNCLLAG
jgi:hypothetical protein